MVKIKLVSAVDFAMEMDIDMKDGGGAPSAQHCMTPMELCNNGISLIDIMI